MVNTLTKLKIVLLKIILKKNESFFATHTVSAYHANKTS